MDVLNFIIETLWQGLESIWGFAVIVFPLMILMEIARDIHLLEWLGKICKPLTRWMGVSEDSAFPLAIGLVFGLAYGAGVIIKSSKDGNLDKRSLILVSIFLACCHAVFEDTLLFVTIGANGWMLLTIRIITAFVLTALISRKLKVTDTVKSSSITEEVD